MGWMRIEKGETKSNLNKRIGTVFDNHLEDVMEVLEKAHSRGPVDPGVGLIVLASAVNNLAEAVRFFAEDRDVCVHVTGKLDANS